jgi:molybdate transport system regulatory protein
MLELEGSIWFQAGTRQWGGRTRIDLLSQVDKTGSITAAARAVGLSYKAAWDAIDTMNNLAGEPLVQGVAGGKGGGGTVLTERARQLIASYTALDALHRQYLIHLNALGENPDANLSLMRRLMLKTSARNNLLGTVTHIQRGAVNDEVVLEMPGQATIVASITHASVTALGLAPGVQAIALVKASWVIIGLPGDGMRLSARNQLRGRISAITDGAVNTEVTLELPGGATITAIVTVESARTLGLAKGVEAVAIFKASSVILGVLD